VSDRLTITGMEQFCADAQMFGNADLDEGSFGSHVVWEADMLARIPDAIELKHAAPLMCAGATVWTALTMYGLKPGDRVGVQGIGGLGHLAIQFAAKLGCEVVVLSSSESKREEATKLGATDFYVMKGDLDLPANKLINHLLICGSGNPDYSK
jgi:D-arabinose 1-dehydrogenase-like Zn-dependent alcohol dehydrogenase